MPEPNIPEYGKPGPAKGQAFGSASLTQALHGIDFPISKQELLNQAGNNTVHVTKTSLMTVNEVLQDCPMDNFESMASVIACPQVKESIKKAA